MVYKIKENERHKIELNIKEGKKRRRFLIIKIKTKNITIYF